MNIEPIQYRDPVAAAVFESGTRSPVEYRGAERRLANRRYRTDRRLEMRFDLSRPDRRRCVGRREGDKIVDFW